MGTLNSARVVIFKRLFYYRINKLLNTIQVFAQGLISAVRLYECKLVFTQGHCFYIIHVISLHKIKPNRISLGYFTQKLKLSDNQNYWTFSSIMKHSDILSLYSAIASISV